jgi:O-antigen/teichoic acid export membrane protein
MSDDADSALRTVTRGASLVLLGTVLQLAIAFFAKVLMARFLELDQYGLVSLGIIAVNFGATIALLGLDHGVARYLPRYESADTKRRVVYFTYALTIGTSILLAGVLYGFADVLSTVVFREPQLAHILRVMAVGIPLWTVMDLGIGVTRGISEASPRVYGKNVALPLSRFVLVAIVVGLGYSGLGVAGAYVGSYGIAAVLITYLVIRRFGPRRPMITEEERSLFSFSIPLTFSNLSSLLYRNVDLVLVGIFWSSSQVAVYNVAYPMARLLLVGTGAFGFLFVPVISSLHADEQMGDASRVYQVTTKWLLIMVTPPFAIMALFPEMAIKMLFGAKYVDGSLTLLVLATGFFLSNVTGLNGSVLTSIGQSKIIMITDTAAMILNLALNLLLIPEFGILGAGITTSVTYLGRDFANGLILYRLTGIHPFTASMLRPTLFTALSVLIIYVPVRLFVQVTLLRLAGLFTLFVAIYTLSIVRLGGIEREDVMIFNGVEEHTGIDLSLVRRVLRTLMG